MKKPIILGMGAVLVLLLLSSCSADKQEVTPVTPVASAPLPAPVASTPLPIIPAAEGNEVGNLAPDFQLNDLNGKTVSLSDFRGKPVLLNFWATW